VRWLGGGRLVTPIHRVHGDNFPVGQVELHKYRSIR
jgi:hypothetical protein